MFGSHDNNDNPYNPGTADGLSSQGATTPVHGPLSNISPGGPANPAGPPSGVSDYSAAPMPINDISPPQPAQTSPPADNDELLNIKHQALENLAPLINHLDQTPEEKFKTTMMLIQASDNPQLLNQAHEAANQIEDEKVRAQALLDVVNEINYFTHQAKS